MRHDLDRNPAWIRSSREYMECKVLPDDPITRLEKKWILGTDAAGRKKPMENKRCIKSGSTALSASETNLSNTIITEWAIFPMDEERE